MISPLKIGRMIKFLSSDFVSFLLVLQRTRKKFISVAEKETKVFDSKPSTGMAMPFHELSRFCCTHVYIAFDKKKIIKHHAICVCNHRGLMKKMGTELSFESFLWLSHWLDFISVDFITSCQFGYFRLVDIHQSIVFFRPANTSHFLKIKYVDGSWYLSPSAAHHQSVYAAQQLAAGGGGSRLPSGSNGSTSSSSPVGRVSSSSSSTGTTNAGHHHHASHRVVPYSVPSAGHKSPSTVPGKLSFFTVLPTRWHHRLRHTCGWLIGVQSSSLVVMMMSCYLFGRKRARAMEIEPLPRGVIKCT